MISQATVERLRWHAGLQDLPGDVGSSLAALTWPRGGNTADLQPAVSDCLDALASLNRELNGATASLTVGADAKECLPRDLAYAVIEVTRMLREAGETAHDPSDARAYSRAAWFVEAAWSGVLAGDIDDIHEHLEEQWAARTT